MQSIAKRGISEAFCTAVQKAAIIPDIPRKTLI